MRPPHDLRAEELVVGARLAGTGWPAARLTPEHFTCWRARVWRAIQRHPIADDHVVVADPDLLHTIATNTEVSKLVLLELARDGAEWFGLDVYDLMREVECAHRRRLVRLLLEDLEDAPDERVDLLYQVLMERAA